MDLRLGLSFAGLLTASLGVMKTVSWLRCPKPRRPPARRFWLSPLFSVESLSRVRPPSRTLALELLAREATLAVSLGAGYLAFPWIERTLPRWSWAYLAMPLIPLYGNFTATAMQIASLGGEEVPPDHHRQPWSSTSVADFWGHRWNTWLSDWFRQVIFLPLRRRPGVALFLTFLFSGLWHEALITLPFFLWTGKALFGLLTLYFLLQFAGMTVERRLPRPARRAFFFLVVAAPCPLFLNEAMLRIILLWPAAPGG
jgi:Membrane bound O-acyl transferase family